MAVHSQSQLDVAPTNVESQPISLSIDTPITESPNPSLDVDMIQSSHPHSPSLTFMEEPLSYTGDHHLLDDLLDHQPIFSETRAESVAPILKSISTDYTLVLYFTIPNFNFINGYPSSIDKCLSINGYA